MSSDKVVDMEKIFFVMIAVDNEPLEPGMWELIWRYIANISAH